MTPTREDLELYVSGNFDGDVEALERAIAEDPKLAAIVAEEAKLDILLRDAAASATFCPSCDALMRSERCDACGAAARPGGYTVERVLVSNAHGRMYVARDADGKRVALKELAFVHAPSVAAHAAFEREAKFLRALEHPAIPRFCASFEEGKGVHARYYLAQELVEGTPLDRLDEHWYRETEIVDIAKQVLAILIYLQSLSPMVIHRDIKPANLVKRSDGSIALVDFGAAHVDGTTVGSTTIGTFGYMPVEQLAGITDATTDCYALGATLLYLLTRQEPWRLAQTKTAVNVSAPLRAFLDKLIATNPRERFASAKDALAALTNKETLVIIPKERRARWRYVAAAAGLLVGGGVFALAHTSEGERQANMHAAEGSSDFGTIRMLLPDGLAKVTIDEQETTAKNGDVIPVVAGGHRVTVRIGDASCEDPHVVVTAGSQTVLECAVPATPDPALAGGKIGELRVELSPVSEEGLIEVDGLSWGRVTHGQVLQVRPGYHHVVVYDRDFQSRCQLDIHITAGERSELSCPFGIKAPVAPMTYQIDPVPNRTVGQLEVRVRPDPTAKLFIDGQMRAIAQGLYDLAPGKHVVKIIGKDKKTCESTIEIEKGKSQVYICPLAPEP